MSGDDLEKQPSYLKSVLLQIKENLTWVAQTAPPLVVFCFLALSASRSSRSSQSRVSQMHHKQIKSQVHSR